MREVLRIREVLHIVNREQCRTARTKWNGSAAMVHDLHVVRATAQPRVLADDSRTAVRTIRFRFRDRQRREFAVRSGKAPRREDRYLEAVVLDGQQPGELTRKILLASADLARTTPQQVHSDTKRHARRPGKSAIASTYTSRVNSAVRFHDISAAR